MNTFSLTEQIPLAKNDFELFLLKLSEQIENLKDCQNFKPSTRYKSITKKDTVKNQEDSISLKNISDCKEKTPLILDLKRVKELLNFFQGKYDNKQDKIHLKFLENSEEDLDESSIFNSTQINQSGVSNLNTHSYSTQINQASFCLFNNQISAWKYHQNNRQQKLYNFTKTNWTGLDIEDDLPP